MSKSRKTRRYIEITRSYVGDTDDFIRESFGHMDDTKNYLLNPVTPITLASLKNNDKRNKDRLATGGVVIIHDLKNNKHFRVNIRNFSIGGLCCEIDKTSSLPMGSEVMIEFVGSISRGGLDVLKSKVMWLTPICNHPDKKMMIGLEFSNEKTATKTKKIAEFLDSLRNELI